MYPLVDDRLLDVPAMAPSRPVEAGARTMHSVKHLNAHITDRCDALETVIAASDCHRNTL